MVADLHRVGWWWMPVRGGAEVVHANPLLIYIELARYSMMENPPLASTFSQLWIMAGAWAGVACMFGFFYFWRGEPEYGRG